VRVTQDAGLQEADATVPLRIGVLVTPQFTLNALANFVDVLRLAGDRGDASGAVRCRYDLMSSTGTPQRASCGYPLAPTRGLIEPSKLDYVALVGGLLYRGRSLDTTTAAYLQEAAGAGIPLVGICTGTFVLCRLGLMQERRVCVSWFHQADFLAEFPHLESVTDALYVIDRDRLTTSGGVGAALAAAALVGRHVGEQIAQKSLMIMQIACLANQQPIPADTPNHASEVVRRALWMMETHIGDALSIKDIASRLKVSRRTLEREFKRNLHESPKQRYLNLRLSQARLLRHGGFSLHQIAIETGFAGTTHLSSAYRRKFGRPLSPPQPRGLELTTQVRIR
jgi:transcriptional regulator GlxA family with amidase domain